MGERPKQAKYTYSDVILYWIYANLCGAERLEDSMVLKEHLENIPGLATPSSDRISQIFRKLAGPITEIVSTNEVKHEFAINADLNNMMLDLAIKLGVIDSTTLDYDNVVVETEKYEATNTYKMVNGYQPGVSFIGKTPVYIEGRSGRSNAVYKMDETLRRCLDLLKSKGVAVDQFRSDSAAYQRSIIELMESHDIKY